MDETTTTTTMTLKRALSCIHSLFSPIQVLCELQIGMLEKGLAHPEDASRDLMPKDIKDIEDRSYRDLRDWFIYRDYMNGLEYVVHSFDHLRKKKKGRRSLE